MGEKPKRPRPAKARTLPPDAKSLEQQFRAIHTEIVEVVQHLKRSPHDIHARKHLLMLHYQRAASFHALHALKLMRATQLTEELNLTYSGELPQSLSGGEYDRTSD